MEKKKIVLNAPQAMIDKVNAVVEMEQAKTSAPVSRNAVLLKAIDEWLEGKVSQ